MNTPEDYKTFSKKGQRQMVPFIASELLYDYVTFQLDADRKEALDAILKDSKELQADLSRVSLGVSYASQMQNVSVTDELLTKIQAPASYFDVLVKKIRFEDWPTGLRLGLESLVVITGIVSVSLLVPWDKVMHLKFEGSKQVVLTELSNTYKQDENVEVASNTAQSQPAQYPDEDANPTAAKDEAPVVAKPEPPPAKVAVAAAPKIVAPTSWLPTAPPPAKVVAVAPAPPPQVAVVTPPPAEPAPQPEPVAPPPPKAVAQAPAPVPMEEEEPNATKATIAEDPVSKEKRQGFLYRGSMVVTNVDAASTKFIEKVNELGGRKAGGVDLGWRKGGGSYFHFTMPESKYESLLTFLQSYGTLKIQREKHDRVMPDGIVRIIIQVDEKKKEP